MLQGLIEPSQTPAIGADHQGTSSVFQLHCCSFTGLPLFHTTTEGYMKLA